MKKILFLSVMFLMIAQLGFSQLNSYIFQSTSGTYTEITGGTLLGSTTSDDERFVDPAVPLGGTTTTGVGFPIGFNFVFNGYTFDRFAINNNGWISLGSSLLTPSVSLATTSSYNSLSSTTTITPGDLVSRIAGFNRDMQGQTGSELRFELTGTTPNQVLVIQWKNYRKYNATGDSYNFQIRLHETSNMVTVMYGTMTNNATNTTAMVGLRGSPSATATNFANRTTTTDWSASTAGALATATMTLTSAIYPASGLTYMWEPATCFPPTNILISNITVNSADLAWTAPTSGVPVNYEWLVVLNGAGTGGTPQASGTTIHPVVTATATGLSASTSYHLYVRTDCGSGDYSAWVGPVSFTTACLNVSIFPYTEAFTAWPPTCWSLTGGTNTPIQHNTGTNYLAEGNFWSWTAGNNGLMTSPIFDVTALTSPVLVFDWSHLYSTTYPGDQLDVLVSDDGGTSWVSVWNRTGAALNSNDGATNTAPGTMVSSCEIDLSAYGNIIQVRFNFISGFGPDCFVDNFTIRETLVCSDPTALTATNITSSSADLGWTAGGTETSWNVEVGLPGFIPGTGASLVNVTGTASNPWSATGLGMGLSYEFYVQANCESCLTSGWAGPYSLSTPCGTVVTFPYLVDYTTWPPVCWTLTGATQTPIQYFDGGSNYSAEGNFYSWSNGTEGFMTSPPIDVSSLTTPVLDFDWSHFYWSSYPNDMLDVLISEDGGTVWTSVWSRTGAAFNSADGATYTAPGSFVNTGIIDLSAYGNNLLIRFNFHSGFGSNCFVDNFRLREMPPCMDPSALTATNITAYTADLGWTENGTATLWNIEFGTTGFVPTGTPTYSGVGNPYNVTGLTPVTDYDFYVQADCGGLGTSMWIGPFTFTTTVTCPEPSNLTANNVLDVSADLAWTENGSATLWNIEFGAAGFAPTGTATSSGVSNPYNISGLTATTSYEYYVQADCGGGDLSIWVGPFAFTTACPAYTAPFLESFSSGILPTCWVNTSSNMVANGLWKFTGTPGYGAAANGKTAGTYAWNDGSTPYVADVTLISPWIDLSTLTNPQLTFEIFSNNTDIPGDNVITYVDINDGSVWTNLYTHQGDDLNWLYNEFSLSAYAGSTVQFRFITDQTVAGTPYYNDILIDEVRVRETPSCPEPSSLTATNITNNSADLGWTENGTSTTWNVELGLPGFIPGTGANLTGVVGTTDNPWTATGGNPNTAYEFYVQADCGGGDLSLWVGPFAFTTLPDPLTNPSACELGYPINDVACVSYLIDVTTAPGTQFGTDVILTDVNFIATHSYDSDIIITLTSPNGVSVDLSYEEGGSGDNFGMVNGACDQFTNFNMTGVDGAIGSGTAPFVGSYIPDGDFVDYNDGSNPVGLWTITICDSYSGDYGTFEYIELVFGTPPPPKDIAWSTTSFVEAIANDGSIETQAFLTLTNETFATTGVLAEATHYNVANVPTGLTVEINATSSTEATVTLTGNATNHAVIDNIANMEITFLDAAFTGGNAADVTGYSQTAISVSYYDAGAIVIINELDADQPGADAGEFIELYDGGVGNTLLDGYVLVLYNGSTDVSYAAYDLDGLATDANGYFVIGNPAVPNVDITFAGNTLQNGQDAVALYMDNASSFPTGTAVTVTNLIDALVYDTDDADDAGLLVLVNPGQPQIDENGAGNAVLHSCSRIPNGLGGLRNTSTYVAAIPTPGESNRPIPVMTWDVTTYVEAVANDGSISNVINVSIADETFAVTGILTQATHYNVANVPSGLTVEINATSTTELTISLIGNAINHANINDVANLTIDFLSASFTSIPDSLITGSIQSTLIVDFMDPVYDLVILEPGPQNYICDATSAEEVPICFGNFGDSDVPAGDTIFMTLEFPIGTVYNVDTMVLNIPMAISDTICTNFGTTIDLSTLGIYDFGIYINYENDSDFNNDTVWGTVESYSVVVDLGGANDTLAVGSYPVTLDAGACASPGGYTCTYLWNDATVLQTLVVNTDGWYYVTVSDDNGCEGIDSIYVVLNIGIEDINDAFNMNVFPNPNEGLFNLVINNKNNTLTTVQLLDLQGQIIETRTLSGKSVTEIFDLTGIATGIYYLKASSENGMKVEKIIIH